MKPSTVNILSALAATFCIASLHTAEAAVITWGTATTVSAGSDISTSGNLVEAINLNDGSVGTVSANGVTFTNDGSLLDNGNSGDFFSGSTGDAGYDQILSDLDFGNGNGVTTLNLGGGNLVSGREYEIQIWFADTRGGDRFFRYGDGNGNTVDLSGGGPQFAIGTFTADGTTQDLTLDPAAYGWGNSHFSAYQIRTVVPEPSTLALLGAGGAMLMAARRRKARA